LEIRRRGRHLDLRGALTALGREGLTEVLVEGGGRLAAALLRADLVDEVHWFSAPRLLGGDAIPALGRLEVGSLGEAIELQAVRVRRVGDDLHLWGAVRRARSAARRRGVSR
jgi:diaminohydroxyphosphoribosylaminopyrimidine deaminase/5-amino-6-(5-phosphoribosylamino)uracil reductase